LARKGPCFIAGRDGEDDKGKIGGGGHRMDQTMNGPGPRGAKMFLLDSPQQNTRGGHSSVAEEVRMSAI